MAELDARRAEVLGNAAKTIQNQIRTHITRKRFVALRMASVLLQSLCRGDLATFTMPVFFCFDLFGFILLLNSYLQEDWLPNYTNN